MSSSGYTAWNVTAGEVPTTAYWNILGSNDASFNTGNGFNDGIILPRHISTTTSTWAWTPWVPNFTGFSLGDGTVDATYVQIGKTVHWQLLVTGGAASSLTGSWFITCPVPAHARYLNSARWPIGTLEFEDAGIGNCPGAMILANLSGALVFQALYYYVPGVGQHLNWSGTGSGVPFTFNLNDTLQASGTYEAA